MFPYTSHENFEDGTDGHFDSETDGASILDIAHYSELARSPLRLAPWRGAYAPRIVLAAANDAYFVETGSWDMTAGSEELYARFNVFLGTDLVMANTDAFALLMFQSAGPVSEGGIFLQYTTANGFRFGIGETAPTSFSAGKTLGQWHTLEVYINPAGGGAGALDGWVDGVSLTQVGSLTQANITQGVYGALGVDAGTSGTILLGDIITDDARIGLPGERFPEKVLLEKSGHVFVGSGQATVNLLSGGAADNVATIYDADDATTTRPPVDIVQNSAAAELVPGKPVHFSSGCYVSLSGTNPRVLVDVHRASGYSEANVRGHGLRR